MLITVATELVLYEMSSLVYLGNFYTGEYLSPGYDCSDIMNHEQDAPDGFYWINLGTNTKRKVSSHNSVDILKTVAVTIIQPAWGTCNVKKTLQN